MFGWNDLMPISLCDWLALNALIAAGGLLIDRFWGEFLNAQHPVVWFGRFIQQFEKRFYQATISRGLLLWLSATLAFTLFAMLVTVTCFWLPFWIQLPLLMLIASTLFAHKMLHDSVLAVAESATPQQAVSLLVSRDTEQMTAADAYKAAVETYAENLSDGVIAPLFFTIFLGIPGLVFYKVINTLDSMVGYRTQRYENFGKVSAKMDDLANWIPARLTAVLIMLVNLKVRFWRFYSNGSQHDSPNAGHPITAMAVCCKCRLGGPTQYFGKQKDKAYFGLAQHSDIITKQHIQCALSKRNPIDAILIGSCFTLAILCTL